MVHTPKLIVENNEDLKIEAAVVGQNKPDSVVVYTNNISFWNDVNPSYKMDKVGNNEYSVIIPASEKKNNAISYNVIVFKDGKSTTFPANVARIL